MTRDAQYFAVVTVAAAAALSALAVWLWRKTRAAELKFNRTWEFWSPIVMGYCSIVMILNGLGIAKLPRPGAAFVLAAGIAAIVGSDLANTPNRKAIWAVTFAAPIGLYALSWYQQLLSWRLSYVAMLSTIGLQTWWVYKGRHAIRRSDV